MSAKTSRKRLSLCIVEYIGVVGVVDVVGVAVRALFGCMCVVVVEGGACGAMATEHCRLLTISDHNV